jgi:serine/threonine protein kinase
MSKLTCNSKKKINLSTWCGTIEYIAPEVFNGDGYGNECDIWSIGVIAYYVLCGEPPFLGTDEEVEQKIITCNYSFKQKIWD